MESTPWLELLGWKEEDLSDLRFVGYSYIKQGHYETALKFFEALVVLSPDSAYDHQTLGAIYLEMGDNNRALKCIDDALMIDPTHEETLLNRTKALFLLGYTERAKTLALQLTKAKNKALANNAQALLLAYR
ncbi:MAG: hypothetical protein SP1CHLAM9_12070 [Chlamydiia bacterium]|nr:hypothetical protein [Chlamydiia bacterium]MCH9624677.1 hypothetical protein [Chlamydiia bacterium]